MNNMLCKEMLNKGYHCSVCEENNVRESIASVRCIIQACGKCFLA
ncbi:hypothetical protein HanIR_Chr15g0778021 [Helianthus annuus]|nr:hypothetical protein HanIR_Chr15g0778021 [Helianthus annuus]